MIKKASYCLFTSILIAAILFIITLISCSNGQIVNPSVTNLKINSLSEEQLAVLNSNTDFGFNLLKSVNSEFAEKNVFISPISVSIAFQMLLNGAEGDTAEEIIEVLNLSGSVEDVNDLYKTLLDKIIIDNDQTHVNLLNSIWYDKNLTVKKSFCDINKNVYNAEVESLNFSSPSATEKINQWVSNSTNGKIKKMLDEIPANAVMYLINAIYFQSQWKFKFDESRTNKMEFNTSGETKILDFMYQKNKFHYYEDDLLRYIELPYGKDSCYSFSIFLPKENRDTDNVINELENNYYSYIINHRERKESQIYLPKFKIEFKTDLKNTLMKMGIKKVFSSQEADLSKISDSNIYADKIIHKSVIEINEEGTEAAAVTAIEIIKMSIGSDIYFIADKPFVFAIKENKSNSVLFLGKFEHP